ncbi:MAG TPA: type II toxin-antitoxin system HigB family toxin [Pirellulales bacterium]|nr:type II toxin-antitoxin system HigB family toxin [Pirellulales bacterium]
MRVISRRKLREFWELHADAEQPLRGWLSMVKAANWKNLAEVHRTFPTADQVGRCTVFNIGGNKYRLIGAIHYNRGIVYVRHVLTHAEYDRDKWKAGCL